MAQARTLDTDRLLADMRSLADALRRLHEQTGTAGAPEAIGVMFRLLDEQILRSGRLPAEWRRAIEIAASIPYPCSKCGRSIILPPNGDTRCLECAVIADLDARRALLGELSSLVTTKKWLDPGSKEGAWGRAYQDAMRELRAKYYPAQLRPLTPEKSDCCDHSVGWNHDCITCGRKGPR
jgi:hypothetical protein